MNSKEKSRKWIAYQRWSLLFWQTMCTPKFPSQAKRMVAKHPTKLNSHKFSQFCWIASVQKRQPTVRTKGNGKTPWKGGYIMLAFHGRSSLLYAASIRHTTDWVGCSFQFLVLNVNIIWVFDQIWPNQALRYWFENVSSFIFLIMKHLIWKIEFINFASDCTFVVL